MASLLQSYKEVKKIADYSARKYKQNLTKRWRNEIFYIWEEQYSASYHNDEDWNQLFDDTLKVVRDAISKDPQKAMEELENKGWAYIRDKEEKIQALEELLGVQDIPEKVKQYLTNFNRKGYFLLFLFMKEVAREKVLESFEELVEETKKRNEEFREEKNSETKEDSSVDKACYEQLLAEIKNKIINCEDISITRINEVLMEKMREIIPGTILGEASKEGAESAELQDELFKVLSGTAIKEISKTTKKEKMNEFFWAYYDTDSILRRIYTEEE